MERNEIIERLNKANTIERQVVLMEAYDKLDKRVLVCPECLGHTVVDKGAEISNCKWCGSEKFEEVRTSFVPLSFGEIKKKDTLEIKSEDLSKYQKEIGIDELKKHFKWFIGKGVIKIITPVSIEYYDFEVIDEDSYRFTHYQYNKQSPAFAMFYSGVIHGGFDHFSAKGILINPALVNVMVKKNQDPHLMINENNVYFKLIHAIFNYLASQRKIEEVKSEIIKGSEKHETSKSGKTITKKRRVIYITDSIKIYTYDNSIVNKLREHKPIMLPFWKVREFKRRVFAKEDKELPLDQRRVVKVSNVPAFLKGKERHKHTLDECQILYKIAR